MFKSYTSNDNLLLPPCLGDFISLNDPIRVVHRIIEQINLKELNRRYSPKGCSAYHPRMMLQILVYAYLRNIYSCLLYTSPSPRDTERSRMPSSA